MTNEEIKNLKKDDILTDWLILEVMSEDKMTRGTTIARIAEHAKAFGMKGLFMKMIAYQERNEAAEERKQRKDKESLERRPADIMNITHFNFPKNNKDLQNMKCGQWIATENGIHREGRYQGELITACWQPVLPVCRYINIETKTERIKIVFKNNNNWQELTVDRSVLASAARIVSLSDKGLAVTSETAKYLVQYLSQVEALNRDIIPCKSSTSRLGWHNEAFLPYDKTIAFDGDLKFEPILADLKPKGSREKWYAFARKVRAGTRIEPKIALAACLSSVLVKICGVLPFFVHFHGQSEGGKTLSAMLGVSAFGNPSVDSAYAGTFDGSKVGFEVKADLLNNLPYFMDDTAQIKKEMDKKGGFAPFIYTLCSGKGRDRSNKNLGLNRTNHWCTTFITTGEEPILEENAQGGAVNRVLEIKCGYDRIFENGNAVAEILKENYGFAGPEFIEIVKKIGKEKIKQIQQTAMEALKPYGKMQKQSLALSVLITADTLAAMYLFEDENTMDIRELASMLKSESEVSDNERALSYILGAIASNPHKFKDDEKEPLNEWWGVKEKEESEQVYVIKSVFDKICDDGGFSARGFLEWAGAKGYIHGSGGRRTKTKRISGAVVRCVCLNMSEIKLNMPDLMEIDGFTEIKP